MTYELVPVQNSAQFIIDSTTGILMNNQVFDKESGVVADDAADFSVRTNSYPRKVIN